MKKQTQFHPQTIVILSDRMRNRVERPAVEGSISQHRRRRFNITLPPMTPTHLKKQTQFPQPTANSYFAKQTQFAASLSLRGAKRQSNLNPNDTKKQNAQNKPNSSALPPHPLSTICYLPRTIRYEKTNPIWSPAGQSTCGPSPCNNEKTNPISKTQNPTLFFKNATFPPSLNRSAPPFPPVSPLLDLPKTPPLAKRRTGSLDNSYFIE